MVALPNPPFINNNFFPQSPHLQPHPTPSNARSLRLSKGDACIVTDIRHSTRSAVTTATQFSARGVPAAPNIHITDDDKIIPLDATTAALAGQLEAKAILAGHAPGLADATIAGIAQAHGLMIVTHNTRHVLPFGVAVTTPDDAVGAASSPRRQGSDGNRGS